MRPIRDDGEWVPARSKKRRAPLSHTRKEKECSQPQSRSKRQRAEPQSTSEASVIPRAMPPFVESRFEASFSALGSDAPESHLAKARAARLTALLRTVYAWVLEPLWSGELGGAEGLTSAWFLEPIESLLDVVHPVTRQRYRDVIALPMDFGKAWERLSAACCSGGYSGSLQAVSLLTTHNPQQRVGSSPHATAPQKLHCVRSGTCQIVIADPMNASAGALADRTTPSLSSQVRRFRSDMLLTFSNARAFSFSPEVVASADACEAKFAAAWRAARIDERLEEEESRRAAEDAAAAAAAAAESGMEQPAPLAAVRTQPQPQNNEDQLFATPHDSADGETAPIVSPVLCLTAAKEQHDRKHLVSTVACSDAAASRLPAAPSAAETAAGADDADDDLITTTTEHAPGSPVLLWRTDGAATPVPFAKAAMGCRDFTVQNLDAWAAFAALDDCSCGEAAAAGCATAGRSGEPAAPLPAAAAAASAPAASSAPPVSCAEARLLPSAPLPPPAAAAAAAFVAQAPVTPPPPPAAAPAGSSGDAAAGSSSVIPDEYWEDFRQQVRLRALAALLDEGEVTSGSGCCCAAAAREGDDCASSSSSDSSFC